MLSLDEAMQLPPVANDKSVSASSCNAPVQASCNSPDRIEEIIDALSLPATKLSDDQMSQLKSLIAEFPDAELGCTELIRHCVDTGNHPPIKQQRYHPLIVHRALISEMVNEMCEQGVVQPSVSPWASSIVLVPKKDVYPSPHIEDILDTLGGSKFFSSLNLASGYWQVELYPDSLQKYCGLFEFVRMPFDLCNAPATFQRLMQKLLAGLEWHTCFVH